MPSDRLRSAKTCKYPKTIRPFDFDTPRRQQAQPPRVVGENKKDKSKELPNLGQGYKKFNLAGGPRKKTDWLRLAMENQFRIKRDCSDNVISRAEQRRVEYDHEDYQNWKRERRDRRTPAVIRGTSADREESPSRSDTEDVTGHSNKINRLVCMDTAHTEADERRIPDIMKPLKEEDSESSPPTTYIKGFGPGNPGFNDLIPTNKKKGGKLLLPPIAANACARRDRRKLENYRLRSDTSPENQPKNAQKKRRIKKGKKKRAKERRSAQRGITAERDGWNYESDFESDSESSMKAADERKRTKRRHKKRHEKREESDDGEFVTGRLTRKESSLDIYAKTLGDCRTQMRERQAQKESAAKVRSWLRQPAPLDDVSSEDEKCDAKTGCERAQGVRSASPNAARIQLNCNPVSNMAPWAWKTKNDLDKLLDDDDEECAINKYLKN